jgi:hypothetical protein
MGPKNVGEIADTAADGLLIFIIVATVVYYLNLSPRITSLVRMRACVPPAAHFVDANIFV